MIIDGPATKGSNSFARKSYAKEPQMKIFHYNGDPPIMFMKETEHLDTEHDDALVVSFRIANVLMKNIMIDNWSFGDILNDNAFQKISLTTRDLQSKSLTLTSCTRDFITLLGLLIFM